MAFKAFKQVFNEEIVQVKGKVVAIGYPGDDLPPEGQVFQFLAVDTVEALNIAGRLRDWLESHLQDNGIEA